mgnify:CR=1 FL=1
MPTADSARPVRILHLEDSDADHELAQYALADSGLAFRLVRATTLPDFMARLTNGHFDVVQFAVGTQLGQRGVLGAGDGHLTLQGAAAVDSQFVHGACQAEGWAAHSAGV